MAKADVIISDLKIRSVELTDALFDQELNNGGKAGWSDWRAFVAGDYQFRFVALRYILQALAAPRPTIPTLTITVDVPDIHDRGTASIAAGPGYTTVAFNRPFTSTADMEVVGAMKGGSVNAVCQFDPTGYTTTTFNVRLIAPDNSFPAGVISWAALGY